MELMYKPGDKVMVRPDLNCREVYRMRSGRYNGDFTYNVVDQMADQAGKVLTILGPRDGGAGYSLEELVIMAGPTRCLFLSMSVAVIAFCEVNYEIQIRCR